MRQKLFIDNKFVQIWLNHPAWYFNIKVQFPNSNVDRERYDKRYDVMTSLAGALAYESTFTVTDLR